MQDQEQPQRKRARREPNLLLEAVNKGMEDFGPKHPIADALHPIVVGGNDLGFTSLYDGSAPKTNVSVGVNGSFGATTSTIAYCSDIGDRLSNEDVASVATWGGHHTFAGVFDGHGGSAVSCEVANTLPRLLSIMLRGRRDKDTSFRRAIAIAFWWMQCRLEREILDVNLLHQGTTAVVTGWDKDVFWWAWTGDSSAFIIIPGKEDRSQQVVRLTDIVHHVAWMPPDSAERVDRYIVPRTGRIQQPKVFSGEEDGRTADDGPIGAAPDRGCGLGINLHRSLGDLYYNTKARTVGSLRKPSDYLVWPLPCVGMISRALIPEDAVLVLVSDGVTDKMSDEEIGDIVSVNYKEEDTDAAKVASLIVETARENGSGDNTTAVVVHL